MARNEEFILTPKKDKTITLTIRIDSEINDKLEMWALQSNRSRNEIINKALEFAFDNIKFISPDDEQQ